MTTQIEINRDVIEGNDILLSPIDFFNAKITDTKKQAVQRFFYCTAIFNMDLETIVSTFQPLVVKMIAGREICPTTGTVHFQCFFQFKKKYRPTELVKFAKAKWIACDGGEAANVKYCSKDGDVYKYGFPKPIKLIENLYPWEKDIETLFFTEPDERKVYWFWEKTGGIGKSTFVKYMVVKHGCLFCDGGKKSDLVNLVFNNNMDDCKCVIWDIPRAAKGNISYSTLECIKNGMICNTKYETGVKVFNSPHIFVFANFPPDKPEELSADRWVITELVR